MQGGRWNGVQGMPHAQDHMQPDHPAIDARELRRQPHRVFMSGLVVLNMFIESGMLWLFAAAGTIEPHIALLFTAAGMTSSLAFYAFFRKGLNLRLKDKGLLVPQLVVNGVVQLVFILLAPKLTILFLITLIAFSGYAALEFTPRQYTTGWLLYGAATAITMWMIRSEFDYPGKSGVEMALVWLFFFLALRSLTLASARFSRLREKLSEKNRQLEESLRQIEDLASHDQLTGVLNRGNLLKLLETELRRTERTGEPFCFAMLDLDHFKSVNDTYGHPVGDQVLKKVCEIATQCVRVVDSMGRMGGEEFGILLPNTSLDHGRVSLERVREAVEACGWHAIAPGLSVHLSAGIAEYALGDSLQTIVKRADDALYRAKHTGRNKVIAAAQPQSSLANA